MTTTIGILTSENGRYSRFWLSLVGLNTPIETKYISKLSLNIAEARNQVVRDSKSDYVWFIDDDHVFDPDTLTKLISHNVPIVQPLVITRRKPFGPVMMGERVEGKYRRISLKNLKPELTKVAAVGAAGMLIRRDVIDAVGDPWFENSPNMVNEDINFCEKAKAKGFDIYADLTTTIGHLNVGYVRPVFKNGIWVTELNFGDATFDLEAK